MAKKVELEGVIPAGEFDSSTIEWGEVSDVFLRIRFMIKFTQVDGRFVGEIDMDHIIKCPYTIDSYGHYDRHPYPSSSLKVTADDLNKIAYNKRSIALQIYRLHSGGDLSNNIIRVYYAPNGKYFTVLELMKCIEDFSALDSLLEKHKHIEEIYRSFGTGLDALFKEINGVYSLFCKGYNEQIADNRPASLSTLS